MSKVEFLDMLKQNQSGDKIWVLKTIKRNKMTHY
jgi:hypothetical protein